MDMKCWAPCIIIDNGAAKATSECNKNTHENSHVTKDTIMWYKDHCWMSTNFIGLALSFN